MKYSKHRFTISTEREQEETRKKEAEWLASVRQSSKRSWQGAVTLITPRWNSDSTPPLFQVQLHQFLGPSSLTLTVTYLPHLLQKFLHTLHIQQEQFIPAPFSFSFLSLPPSLSLFLLTFTSSYLPAFLTFPLTYRVLYFLNCFI